MKGIAIASALMVGLMVAFTSAQSEHASALSAKTVWDGVYTEEQSKRGAQTYADHCAMCHGDGLGGVESAPALTGPGFYSTWESETLDALFERIRMSMPQDNPGSLSRAQNADVIAYMLNVGGYPAGMTELEGQTASLSAIKVLTYKP